MTPGHEGNRTADALSIYGPQAAELVREANALLQDALEQAKTLRRTGDTELAGQLLRSVHSYKSLMAFAGDGPRSRLAGDLEDYLEDIWQGGVEPDPPAHDIINRSLLHLQSSEVANEPRALDLGQRIRGGARPQPVRASTLFSSSTPRPSLESRRVAQLPAHLTLGDLSELTQTSSGLCRMARRLTDVTPGDDPRLEALAAAIASKAERLNATLRQLSFVNLRAFLLPMAGSVKAMAATHDKQVSVKLNVEDTDVALPLLVALRPSILHLLRNAVAHGLEEPEARVAAGKPLQGRILLTAKVAGQRLHLRVRDDGQGFDTKGLREAAVAHGQLSPESAGSISDSEAIRYAYLAGLSTTTVSDELSGHGLGLTVVAEQMCALGGRVDIRSERGRYSQVSISVPLPGLDAVADLRACQGGSQKTA